MVQFVHSIGGLWADGLQCQLQLLSVEVMSHAQLLQQTAFLVRIKFHTHLPNCELYGPQNHCWVISGFTNDTWKISRSQDNSEPTFSRSWGVALSSWSPFLTQRLQSPTYMLRPMLCIHSDILSPSQRANGTSISAYLKSRDQPKRGPAVARVPPRLNSSSWSSMSWELLRLSLQHGNRK